MTVSSSMSSGVERAESVLRGRYPCEVGNQFIRSETLGSLIQESNGIIPARGTMSDRTAVGWSRPTAPSERYDRADKDVVSFSGIGEQCALGAKLTPRNNGKPIA